MTDRRRPGRLGAFTGSRFDLAAAPRHRIATFYVGALAALVVAAAGSCGPKEIALPAGPGSVFEAFRAPFQQAAGPCSSVTSMTAEMRLSGRSGSERLRGTLVAGFQAPDAIRLEAVAPFGQPVFILVARGTSATLLLPRDNRVVTGASACDILDAIVGIRLDPATLGGLVSGCVVSAPEPTSARSFPNGWLTLNVASHVVVPDQVVSGVLYLQQQQGQWRIVAGEAGGVRVQYQQFEGGLPRRIALHRASSAADAGGRDAGIQVDLALALSQVAVNVALERAAFEVAVPPDAVPLPLAELRRNGPLGGK